jgi:hypothetical protein
MAIPMPLLWHILPIYALIVHGQWYQIYLKLPQKASYNSRNVRKREFNQNGKKMNLRQRQRACKRSSLNTKIIVKSYKMKVLMQ